jgi:hypothetical protein
MSSFYFNTVITIFDDWDTYIPFDDWDTYIPFDDWAHTFLLMIGTNTFLLMIGTHTFLLMIGTHTFLSISPLLTFWLILLSTLFRNGTWGGVFSDIFPSDRTITLGSTQPLVKLSTRNIPGGKVREADNLTTSMCRMSWKSGSRNLL